MIPSDKAKIETSNFYNKKKGIPLVLLRKDKPQQSPIQQPTKNNVNAVPRMGIKSKRKSPSRKQTSHSTKKAVTNAFGKKSDVFPKGKTGDSMEVDCSPKKRTSLDESDQNEERPSKVPKLSTNTNETNSTNSDKTSDEISKETATVRSSKVPKLNTNTNETNSTNSDKTSDEISKETATVQSSKVPKLNTNTNETNSTNSDKTSDEISKETATVRSSKVPKLSTNTNETNNIKSSDEVNDEIGKDVATVQYNADQKAPVDLLDFCTEQPTPTSLAVSSSKTTVRTATKQQNLKRLLKTLEKPQTLSNEINPGVNGKLGESSQSPILFSSTSSSSGLGSSPNSRTSSPSQEQQSSITKYFSSTRPDSSNSPQVSDGISPRRRSLRLGKDAPSPSSPASNKKEQMYLDLGQKDFGHVTCPTCNMVYTRAQPEDEADHLKFHQKFVTCLRFKGWKTECILEHYDDGRVIVVSPKDPASHLKKAADVRSVVDNELGFSSETSVRMQDAQTYMFITSNKVVGCVVAVDVQQAYPILPSEIKDHKKAADVQGAWCCSSTPTRAQCGISRMWVLKQYRRQGIATRLLDCVRNHFIYGCVVGKESLAFSDPTPVGKQLAESYIGSKTFLVFR